MKEIEVVAAVIVNDGKILATQRGYGDLKGLTSELDYLKYQINPHFFMNTLNNIHALVDIDSKLAKDAIIELSRMMRYMLYETSSPTVPLRNELEFHRHFVQLMRLRFDDSVKVNYQDPDKNASCLNAQVPPLIGIVFIENAFKYGISHRHSPAQVASASQQTRDVQRRTCGRCKGCRRGGRSRGRRRGR